jgi:integrase
VASIRKRKRAKGDVWIVDYRDAAGTRRWVTCSTRREAEDVLAAKIRESRQAVPVPDDPDITVAAYAEQWLARVAPDLRRQTLQSYAQLLRLYILPALGSLRIRALHRGVIRALLAEKRAAGLSKNTVRLIRATLSVLLTDAVDDGLLLANPAHGLGRQGRRRHDAVTQAERQRRIRPLSPERLAAFLVAAEQHEPRHYPYFLVLARAGLRPGEGLGLQWPDLSFAEREIRVERALIAGREEAPKTDTIRTVDMSRQLARALRRLEVERKAETLRLGWPAVPPWVFCSEKGTPLDLANVGKAFKRVLKLAGLPSHHVLYDLRHSFATTLLAEGVPITYVAAQLGHAKATTTLLWYAHWIPRGDKRWVDALDGAPAGARGSQLVAKIESGDPGVPEPPDLIGEPWRNRTSNLLIKSQLLYQLS